jgi:hypothetical protein
MTAATLPVPTRSPENWFLDAEIYARDGNVDDALAAANRGIEALENCDQKVTAKAVVRPAEWEST